MKKLLLLLCISGLLASNVTAKINNNHIIIKKEDSNKNCSNNFLKNILPLIAGMSFLNYAINPEVSMSPAFLLRGINGFICGVFNKNLINSETLLRVESSVAGTLLIGSTIVKIAEGADNYVIRPTFRAVNNTYNGFKQCFNFINKHKVISALGALGIGAAVYQIQ